MSTEHVPLWQQVSGLTPERELAMSDTERDEALSKLYEKFVSIARAQNENPRPERTLAWDAVARVCFRLEISRVQLSRYMSEFTGLRSTELCDFIKAETIQPAIEEFVERFFEAYVPMVLATRVTCKLFLDEGQAIREVEAAFRALKLERSGPMAARWAASLGFASAARVKKAFFMQHERSIDDVEFDMLRKLMIEYFKLLPTVVLPGDQVEEEAEQLESTEPAEQPKADSTIAHRPSSGSARIVKPTPPAEPPTPQNGAQATA
jgi:hypothetical protein